ncbi:MAG: hypothetical protein ACLVL7_09190 [Anaerotruncus massiliensis (ex Togo et al. 2019)]
MNAVKSSPSVLERLYGGIEDNRILTSVRRGMVLAIPEILVGSFALLLLSPGWRLADAARRAVGDSQPRGGGDATLGVISLIMLLTISYSRGGDARRTPGTLLRQPLRLPRVHLRAGGLAFAAFESSRLFGAIVVTIASCALFTLSERFSIRCAPTPTARTPPSSGRSPRSCPPAR